MFYSLAGNQPVTHISRPISLPELQQSEKSEHRLLKSPHNPAVHDTVNSLFNSSLQSSKRGQGNKKRQLSFIRLAERVEGLVASNTTQRLLTAAL